jgi:hypothetical protein
VRDEPFSAHPYAFHDRLSAADLDPLGVAPQALEAIELPRLGREDVNDEVEVVEEDPFRLFVAASASVVASAIARICRGLVPEQRTK